MENAEREDDGRAGGHEEARHRQGAIGSGGAQPLGAPSQASVVKISACSRQSPRGPRCHFAAYTPDGRAGPSLAVTRPDQSPSS